MQEPVNITVHPSQFPDSVKRDFLEGLRTRQIAPRFLYQSYRQGELWLALHRKHSPASNDDSELLSFYAHASAVAALDVGARGANVVALGCGGGIKEAMPLLFLAGEKNPAANYVPSDVSLPLLLRAAEYASKTSPSVPCKPLLCDLSLTEDLPVVLDKLVGTSLPRIITFFGLIPNFEPDAILPKLSALVRDYDLLLFSANLAPGENYRVGVETIFGGYDNQHTRDWLMAFMEDIGVRGDDGVLKFSIEESGGYWRIVANFHFTRERVVTVHDEKFAFEIGEEVRLFFSYRYTPVLIQELLQKHGLEVRRQWIAESGEEGVFLCGKVTR